MAPGSFAELAVAREDKLAAKPANVGFAEAAVVPISAGTALQALVDVGRVRAGQSVLVLGASGGVGSYAVQLAKAFGAEVTGVCSTAKVDFVRSLGAERVIDYTQEDWASSAGRFDLVLGIGGSRPIERLRRALTERGTVVFVGGEQGGSVTGLGRQLRGALLVSPVVPQRLALLVAKERGVAYQRLTGLIEAGDVTPTLDRSFPLREAAVAVRMLEQGRVRGKLAIAL